MILKSAMGSCLLAFVVGACATPDGIGGRDEVERKSPSSVAPGAGLVVEEEGPLRREVVPCPGDTPNTRDDPSVEVGVSVPTGDKAGAKPYTRYNCRDRRPAAVK